MIYIVNALPLGSIFNKLFFYMYECDRYNLNLYFFFLAFALFHNKESLAQNNAV